MAPLRRREDRMRSRQRRSSVTDECCFPRWPFIDRLSRDRPGAWPASASSSCARRCDRPSHVPAETPRWARIIFVCPWELLAQGIALRAAGALMFEEIEQIARNVEELEKSRHELAQRLRFNSGKVVFSEAFEKEMFYPVQSGCVVCSVAAVDGGILSEEFHGFDLLIGRK